MDKSLVEVMGTLRGIRHFSDAPVPHPIVRRVLELATKAANDRNLQDWRWLVIRDPATRARIGEIYLDALLDYHKTATAEEALAKPGLPAMQRDSLLMARGMGEAPPVLILACYHQTSGLDPGMSVFPAIQNLMLAAWSFGLGTVMTTVAKIRRAAALRALLGIPDDVEIVALIPMGYPSRPYGPPRRRPVEEVAFNDRWGSAFREP